MALSLIRPRESLGAPPGVTRHRSSMEPGLSSPEIISAAAAQPSGAVNMGY